MGRTYVIATASEGKSEILTMESTISEGEDSYALVKNIIWAIPITCSIFGNLTLLVVIRFRIKRLQRRSAVYMLLCNLAVADLIVSGVFTPMQIGWISMESGSGVRGPWVVDSSGACKTVAFLNSFGLYLSAFAIVSITVDRYLAIIKPFTAWNAARRTKVVMILVWIISITCCLPEILFQHMEPVPSAQGLQMCTSYGSFQSREAEMAYALFQTGIFSGLPLLTMLVCYPHMLIEMRKMQANTGDLRRSCRTNMIGRAKARTIKLSLIIGAAFLICWLPYHIFMLLEWTGLSNSLNIHPIIIQAIKFLAACNQCFNPAIYGWFHLFKARSRGSTAGARVTIPMSTLRVHGGVGRDV